MTELSDVASERATIPFPRLVSVDEAEYMLRFLAQGLDAEMRITTKRDWVIYDPTGSRERDHLGSLGVFEFAGRITPKNTSSAGENFSFRRFTGNTDLHPHHLSALSFYQHSGDTISRYREDTIALWDDTRKQVKDYFLSHSE